jgi:hypothetical protein
VFYVEDFRSEEDVRQKMLKENAQFLGTGSPEKRKHFLPTSLHRSICRPRRKPCFRYSAEQHTEEIKVDLLHRSP